MKASTDEPRSTGRMLQERSGTPDHCAPRLRHRLGNPAIS